MNQLKLFFVTFGYLGLAPFAPGTFGTLGGVAIAWALRGSDAFLGWMLGLSAALYLVARTLGPWAERWAGGKDPGFFVVDEVIGFLVTIAWVRGPSTLTLVLAFLLFRFFDIAKLQPARWLENLGGGDGILLDDVAAGVYALAVLTLARLLFLEPDRWVA